MFVRDINVISFNSSRYFELSLNTGPITILTPCSYNSFEDLKVFIGFDFVSLGTISIIELSILFIVLVLTYLVSVDDNEANDDPSWITLDEIVGMSLVTIASPSRLLPLLAGFLVFRLSDIMKQPKFVAELEKHPGKLGVLYDDLGAGLMGLLSATIVNQIINLTL